MLYWLMDLRYREIASEVLYIHYLNVKAQVEAARRLGATPSRAEVEYDELHMRMAIFEPNLKQRKREELMEELKVWRTPVY